MPQIAAQADGLIDRLTTQATDLSTLKQTVARGVPALRDAAENVLELNPATSTPLLASNANDIGTSFSNGVLAVVDQTGQEQRALTADKVVVGDGATEINAGGLSGQAATLSAYLYVAGSGNAYVFAHDGKATATDRYEAPGATFGGVNIGYGYGVDTEGRAINVGNSKMDVNGLFGNQVNGFGASFGGVSIGGGIDTGGGTIQCGTSQVTHAGVYGDQINGSAGSIAGVRMNGGWCQVGTSYMNGAQVEAEHIRSGDGGFTTLYYYALVAPPSERAMKIEESPIRNGLDVVRLLVPARWRWRAPHPAVGPVAPELDPDLHASVYVDEVAEVAPELIHTRDDGTRSYDDRGLTAYLISAVQTLADQVATLTARLDALEAT